MCITFFCSCPKTKGSLKFILAFNREEQTQRQTLKMAQFHEDLNIYGGRDVLSGGTWLGVNIQTGLLVFLTNYITNSPSRQGISRGKIVSHFLVTSFIPQSMRSQTDEIVFKELQQFSKKAHEFAPFNLTVCNLRTGNMYYMCSQWKQLNPLQLLKGQAYGLSNSDIRTPWQKTKHGSLQFQQILSRVDFLSDKKLFEELTSLMQNTFIHNDLPDDFSTIFVKPHWSERAKAERRTKSTTLILSKEVQGKKEVIIKEITYGVEERQQVLLELIV